MYFTSSPGFYISLLIAVGFITTTSADRTGTPNPYPDWFTSGVDYFGKFGESCRPIDFNNDTCTLRASCIARADTEKKFMVDFTDVNKPRRETILNMNKCKRFYKKEEGKWMLEWKRNKEDQGDVKNFCKLCTCFLPTEDILHPEGRMYKLFCFDCKFPKEENGHYKDEKDESKKQGPHLSWAHDMDFLDEHISNNDGFLECFGQTQPSSVFDN